MVIVLALLPENPIHITNGFVMLIYLIEHGFPIGYSVISLMSIFRLFTVNIISVVISMLVKYQYVIMALRNCNIIATIRR